MSLLHVLNKSPFDSNALDSCLRLAKEGASILFIEDGVYAVRSGTVIADTVQKAVGKHQIYALSPDTNARGLESDNMIDNVSLVDYDGFVNLASEHDNVKTWL